MTITTLTLLLGAPAQAQTTSTDDAPLAIPVPSPAPSGADRRPPQPATVRVSEPRDALSEGRATQYRERYLAVRTVTELDATPGLVLWGPFGIGRMWPPAGPAVGSLAVVQGREWLDVPSVLGALGDQDGQRQVHRRIVRNRSAAAFLRGVAVAGVGGLVAGLVGNDRASTPREVNGWNAVAAVGTSMLVVGLTSATIPARRADRLQRDVSSVIPIEELQERVQEHNRDLAGELGIRPERATRLEQ